MALRWRGRGRGKRGRGVDVIDTLRNIMMRTTQSQSTASKAIDSILRKRNVTDSCPSCPPPRAKRFVPRYSNLSIKIRPSISIFTENSQQPLPPI